MRRSVLAAAGIAAALAIGGGALALAAGPSRSATEVTVCVKDNGQLRLETPSNPTCDASEHIADWTVGGELTDALVAPPLLGEERDGILSLGLDDSFVEAANSGKIFAGFVDAGDIPRVEAGGEPEEIARLAVPSGAYAISAKLSVTGPLVGITDVRCRLRAGSDFDESRVAVSSVFNTEDFTDALGMPLEVVHRFAEPGFAVIACAGTDDGVKSVAHFEFLKIVAIRAFSLSNHFLG
jgi:hypothetical protein